MKKKYGRRLGVLLACASLLAGTVVLAGEAPEKMWEYEETAQESDILYSFDEVELTLPMEWEGKIVTKLQDDSLGFYHKDSLEAGNLAGETGCGALFFLHCSENTDFTEYLPNYYLTGSGEKGVYYITVPGDLHGYQRNAAILDEWKKMSAQVLGICEKVKTKYPGVPMYAATDVNFRSQKAASGRILDVIEEGDRVWVTGNFISGWAKVRYHDYDGYVAKDYLEFFQNAPDMEETGGGEEEKYEKDQDYTGEERPWEEGKGSGQEEEIPPQGAFSCVVYDKSGADVIIRMAADGNWYDDNGLSVGTWDEVENFISDPEAPPLENTQGEISYRFQERAPGWPSQDVGQDTDKDSWEEPSQEEASVEQGREAQNREAEAPPEEQNTEAGSPEEGYEEGE